MQISGKYEQIYISHLSLSHRGPVLVSAVFLLMVFDIYIPQGSLVSDWNPI